MVERRLKPPNNLIYGLVLRQVEEKDLPALEWEGEYVHFRNLFKKIYRDTLAGKAEMWIAELEGVGIVGQFFVQLKSSQPDLADGRTVVYIFSVRVKPGFRRIGIGTQMITFAEARLRALGFRKVTLNVAKDNRTALRFYKNLGYQIAGHEPGRWSYVDHLGKRRKVVEPSWRMVKRLE